MTRATALMASMSGTLTETNSAPRPRGGIGNPAHRPLDLGIQPVEEEVLRQADPYAAQTDLSRRQVVRYRAGARRIVAGVAAGDDVKHDGGVTHRGGKRARMIQREIQRQNAVAADPPRGRLQAHGAAKRSRYSD